jgi:hypothetical protein
MERKEMKLQFFIGVVLCLLSPLNAEAHRDRGSWKKTLHEKAAYFAKNTAERHNIEGTYPSSVRLLPPNHYVDPSLGGWKTLIATGELPPGWTFDQGTTGDSNIAHTSSWTGNLLTGEAFHVAFLRDTVGTDHPKYKAAYDRANEVIHGLRILTLVSGVRGYLARGIAYGHGITYGERWSGGGDSWDLWLQGVGEYKHFRKPLRSGWLAEPDRLRRRDFFPRSLRTIRGGHLGWCLREPRCGRTLASDGKLAASQRLSLFPRLSGDGLRGDH